MFKFLKFIIWFCLFRDNYAARNPVSPCPNVFSYEGEPESDRWYGIINFSSNIELVGLTYKVQLDRPANLLVSWDGEVTSEDNINFLVFDPFHTQRAREVVKATIMVKYNPGTSPPTVTKININGNVMCSTANDGLQNPLNSGSGWTESTTRYDPSFEDAASESSHRGSDSWSNAQYSNTGSSYNSVNYEYVEKPNSAVPNYANSKPTYVLPSNNAASNPNYASSNYESGASQNNAGNSNSAYSNPNTQYVLPENTNYATNQQPVSSNFGTGHSQWSDSSSSSSFDANRTSNRPAGNVGSVNSGASSLYENNNEQLDNPVSNSAGPIVTTLTIPNSAQNKTNIDQIVQIIKNQLEQQQLTSNSNKTFIVAVVNQMSSTNVPISNGQVVTEQSQSRRITLSSSSSAPISSSNKTRVSATTTTKPYSITNRNSNKE